MDENYAFSFPLPFTFKCEKLSTNLIPWQMLCPHKSPLSASHLQDEAIYDCTIKQASWGKQQVDRYLKVADYATCLSLHLCILGVQSLRQEIVSQNGSIPWPESNSAGYWWSGYGAVHQKADLQKSTWPGNFLQHLESMVGSSGKRLATREQVEQYSPWRKTIHGQSATTGGRDTRWLADVQNKDLWAISHKPFTFTELSSFAFGLKPITLNFRRPSPQLSPPPQSNGLTCDT